MKSNDSSSSVILKEYPVWVWVFGAFLIGMAVMLYVASQAMVPALVLFLMGIAIVVFLASIETVSVDRFRRVLTISHRSLLRNQSQDFPFQDIADFEVEASRQRTSGRHRTVNYRLVLVRTNGEKVPVQAAYTSNYNDKAQKAKLICGSLNLPGWQDKSTNIVQAALQAQRAMTAQPQQTQSGNTAGVSWSLEVHSLRQPQVTRWVSTDFTCPGKFLLVAQKPKGSPARVGTNSLMGNLAQLVYQQILGMYGFLPGDTPGLESATALSPLDAGFDQSFATLTSDPVAGRELLNPWSLRPLLTWAERHPLRTVSTGAQAGQLAVLYSPRGLQVAVLGGLDPKSTEEIIEVGAALVKAQGAGQRVS